eukprot:TRINITY_DN10225_c0_g1_i2.p1 TRINITY_DN10225_c0_g1~~TRINITY_DN10225_c0_g1_i2.p1  ORF type:complete len:503 (+),score=74.49 TRINITY_DN10225_c0_g1_i2:95-1603(+)
MALGAALAISAKPEHASLLRVPNEFDDIQMAINSAQSGDCICISSGEYVLHQPLLIDRNLHIMGADDGVPTGVVLTLDRRNPSLFRTDLHMVTVTAVQSLRLTRITFNHIDSSGSSDSESELVFALLLKEGNVLVDRCVFHSQFASAIGVTSPCQPTIVSCRIKASEYGVFCCENSPRTYVKQCRMAECGTGIFFDEGSEGSAEENVVHDCKIGIEVTTASRARVLRNTINGCTEAGVYYSGGSPSVQSPECLGNTVIASSTGIKVQCGGNPSIEKNIVQECEVGLLFTETAAGSALWNEILVNAVGIRVEGGAAPMLRKNVVRDNKAGVVVSGQGSVGIIKDNDISGCLGTALSILDTAAPSVLENRIFGNSQAGVVINAAGRCRLSMNHIYGNEGDGVVVSESDVELLENSSSQNRGNGLRLLVGAAGRFANNTFSENGQAGVEADGCQALPVVVENVISRNATEGVLVHKSSAIVSKHNNSFENGTQDVYVGPDSSVEI